MLKGTFLNQYRKQGGALIARYAVTGPKAEIDKFKEVQEKGGFLRLHENGSPIFFVNLYDGNGQRKLLDAVINISYSQNPALGTERYILDTSAEELRMASTIKNLMPQAIASEMAKAWLHRTTPTAATPTAAEPAPSVENELEKMGDGAGVEELEGAEIQTA